MFLHPRRTVVGLTCLSAVALGVGLPAAVSGQAPVREANATLKNSNGQDVGRFRLVTLASGAVQVRVSMAGVRERGLHGFHVHSAGVCDASARNAAGAPAPFDSAGPHHRRAGQVHGGHAGDFPPLFAQESGRARAVVETDNLTVAELFDNDGSAIMLHRGSDNLANIPSRYRATGPDAETLETGDAGARIACGVLQRVSR